MQSPQLACTSNLGKCSAAAAPQLLTGKNKAPLRWGEVGQLLHLRSRPQCFWLLLGHKPCVCCQKPNSRLGLQAQGPQAALYASWTFLTQAKPQPDYSPIPAAAWAKKSPRDVSILFLPSSHGSLQSYYSSKTPFHT